MMKLENIVTFKNYREFIRAVYFNGYSAFRPINDAFKSFHIDGIINDNCDIDFLTKITYGLNKLAHPNDFSNVVTLLAADIIYDEINHKESISSYKSSYGSLITKTVKELAYTNLDTKNDERPNNHVTNNELVRFISLYLPGKIDNYLNDCELPKSLPLIDYMTGFVGEFGCEVCAVVGVQHLFGSTIPLIQALIDRGVPAEGVFLLGKPYSTSHPVYCLLKNKHNVYVHPGSFKYSGELEYHTEAKAHIETLLHKTVNWMQNISKNPNSKAIVLDDGGLLIRKLHEPAFEYIRHRFICVEQTRRGITELKNTKLEIPVINVAESKAKLIHESPLIAESVRDELFETINQLKVAGIDVSMNVLVIGYGSIGSSVAKAFRREGWNVGVLDRNVSKCEIAVDDGFDVYKDVQSALSKYQVIIGCTGKTAFVFDDIKYLQNNAILVSASSSDIEFSAWEMRSLAMALSSSKRRSDKFNLIYERVGNNEILLGDPDDPCHFLYIVRAFGKIVYLCGGGFPVNMPGSIDPIEANKIQLTRSLLYSAAIQATKEKNAGLIDLDLEYQEKIIDKFYADGYANKIL